MLPFEPIKLLLTSVVRVRILYPHYGSECVQILHDFNILAETLLRNNMVHLYSTESLLRAKSKGILIYRFQR